MIVLLGGSGYVGNEFVKLFQASGTPFQSLSRRDVDYYNADELATALRAVDAEFLINCAGFTGKPNVDACEVQRTACVQGNVVLPGMISEACAKAEVPWGHVSSGCIFTGQKPDGSGFSESDPPNFSFRQNNCSFYSGCKALGEECLVDDSQCYIWRLRIPFSHIDSSRNYLSKLMRYARLLDARNSLSFLDDFVAACVDCWKLRVPFGTYNLTNEGSVTARDVVELIKKSGVCNKDFSFFEDEAEFMKLAAKTPRSNTVLDNRKALSAGLKMRPVQESIEIALRNWQPELAAVAID